MRQQHGPRQGSAERQCPAGRIGHAEADPATFSRVDEPTTVTLRASRADERRRTAKFLAPSASAVLPPRQSHLKAKDSQRIQSPGRGLRLGHFQKNRPFSKLKILPQRRSRCTGITGTLSSPYMIFSKPRLNGSRLPVRLIAPSAKIQTTCP